LGAHEARPATKRGGRKEGTGAENDDGHAEKTEQGDNRAVSEPPQTGRNYQR
jgi:hypothetical protein